MIWKNSMIAYSKRLKRLILANALLLRNASVILLAVGTTSCVHGPRVEYCLVSDTEMACAKRGAVPFDQADNFQCLHPEESRVLLRACRAHLGLPAGLNFCQISGAEKIAGCADGKVVDLSEIINWHCLSPHHVSRLLDWCRRRQDNQ